MKRHFFRPLLLSLALALPLSLSGMAAAPSATLPEVVDAPMLFDRPLPASPAVDPGWFSDAVFIGDSRGRDLEQAQLLQTGLWLTEVGLNVRTVRTDAVFTVNGQKLTLKQALEGKSFRKVYVMLGVNEASWMDENTFYNEYSALIDDLRALLPGAGIYIQTLIPVTVARAAARAPDNVLLASRSSLLRRLAQEKQVYLVDSAAPLTAASGALSKEYSTDGLHLNADGIALLSRCLRTHTAGT